MKITVLDEARTVIRNDDSINRYFAWPTLKRLKNGRLALGASGYRMEHICPFGKATLSFSETEGGMWSVPAPVIDTMLDDRDTGLCPFGESGLIITSFNNTREMQRGFLNGHINPRTEKEKAYVLAYLDLISDGQEAAQLGSTYKVSYDNGVTFGPLQRSPVTSPHGPIELSDGRVLWVGTEFFSQDDRSHVEAYEMDLSSGTMTKIGAIENVTENGTYYGFCEPYTVELADGTLVCHLRTDRTFATFQSVSKDGGRTWSKPERLWGDFLGAPVHTFVHSSGVLVGTYGFRNEPYGICAMFSKDGGKTWEIQRHIYINPFSSDLGYPCSVELADGSVLTVFYAIEEQGGPCVIMQTRWRFDE